MRIKIDLLFKRADRLPDIFQGGRKSIAELRSARAAERSSAIQIQPLVEKCPVAWRAGALVITAGLLLFSCARQAAPTGGPKDTTPPQVDTTNSTRNYSTHFTGKRIELRFDEWIKLADVQSQVLVSPPLVTKRTPNVTLRGKTVIVEIPKEEVLRPNTTYTINFGSSVKDLHEDNVAKDLRFVFSTGDYIDSLSLRGLVRDALTGAPVENISVMLYDKTEDSIIRKEKPYYFSKTDKKGEFFIQNIRNGRFKCVAIEDADQNLKWSGDQERIGFPDSLVTLPDSSKGVLSLRVFSDFSKLRLLEKNATHYGQVKLTYNATPDTVMPRPDSAIVRILTERVLDTIICWYDLPSPAAWKLLAGKDTVPVKNLSREDFLKTHRLGLAGEAAPAGSRTKRGNPNPAPIIPGANPAAQTPQQPVIQTVNQHPFKPASIVFNYPLATVDTAFWRLKHDSTEIKTFTAGVDSTSPRKSLLTVPWTQGKLYTLTLLPGAVTDFFGQTNKDTLQRKFSITLEKSLGTLNLTLKHLKPGAHYLVSLVNGNNAVEESRSFDATDAEKRFVFANLPATQFTIRLVEDINRNGRWDTGSYFNRRQPEPVVLHKLDTLRSNWEVEASVSTDEEPPAADTKK